MLIIRASLLSSYGKNVTEPRNESKDLQFKKLILHVSVFSFWPFFLVLFITVTFCSFYGEVPAERYYRPQDVQFARNCQKPPNPRFQLNLRCLPSERHFEVVTVKLSLNAITKRLQISEILSHASKASFSSSYFVLSMIVTFWSFYGKILAEPYYCPKNNQFPKQSQTPQNNPS